jgi:cardiolipin synthase C
MDNEHAQSDLTGLHLLHEPKEAFAARLMLLRSAQQSLDIQYYIWHDDLTGALILEEIVAAADRDVAVRLLLDDNGITGLDARLAALNDHPCVDVRLFNPFPLRHLRALNWLFAFRRLNARMHAKSLTADRHATIVGGRNIGDEYFGAQSKGQFEDLDVLAIGPIAIEVEQVFERHWQSPHTRTIASIVGRISGRSKRKAATRGAGLVRTPAAKRYMQEIETQPFLADLDAGQQEFLWAPARAVATMPAPGDDSAIKSGLDQLMPPGLAKPEHDMILICGYFVPTRQGCQDLADLRRKGVRLRVLTNSFAATDVGVVHAGYAPYRLTLLGTGVELFEMPAPNDKPKAVRKFVRSGSARSRRHSGSSLHAKAYIVDRTQLYIGSANFDPRSAHINTELGLLIQCPEIAELLVHAFDEAAQTSYCLSLSTEGQLRWTDQRDDEPKPECKEPGTTIISRAVIHLLSKVSIEDQL